MLAEVLHVERFPAFKDLADESLADGDAVQAQVAAHGAGVGGGLVHHAFRQGDERRTFLGAMPGHECFAALVVEIKNGALGADDVYGAFRDEAVQRVVRRVAQDGITQDVQDVENAAAAGGTFLVILDEFVHPGADVPQTFKEDDDDAR